MCIIILASIKLAFFSISFVAHTNIFAHFKYFPSFFFTLLSTREMAKMLRDLVRSSSQLVVGLDSSSPQTSHAFLVRNMLFSIELDSFCKFPKPSWISFILLLSLIHYKNKAPSCKQKLKITFLSFFCYRELKTKTSLLYI